MAEKHHSQRQIQMFYSFDRLATPKISQAYRLLVPEKVWPAGKNIAKLTQQGDNDCEGSSNLHASIIGEAKRRTNYR
jgi:hypothetical protein